MKRIILISFIFLAPYIVCFAQNKNTGDTRTPLSRTENNWDKTDNETPTQTANQITLVDGITYNATNEGLFITMPKATYKVKLFSLTGELVWSGDLVQGKFFIPTRRGIYFLRINNKSYKVVCK